MAYVDKINVQGTDYDIRDKRIAGTEDVNVKPVYYHPISIISTDNSEAPNYCLSFIILNNSATAFTLATFLQFIKDLASNNAGVARMNCSGFYSNGLTGTDKRHGSPSILAYVYNGWQLILGDCVDDWVTVLSGNTDEDIFGEGTIEFADGVNKIN